VVPGRIGDSKAVGGGLKGLGNSRGEGVISEISFQRVNFDLITSVLI